MSSTGEAAVGASSSPSQAPAQGSARSLEPPSKVTFALLACFISRWRPSANGDGQNGVSPPTNEAFDYFLRVCFTLDAMHTRLAGPSSQQTDNELQPTMQVTKTKGADQENALVLHLEKYSLELHVSQYRSLDESYWYLTGVVLYNEDERIATGQYPCFPVVLEVADRSSGVSEIKKLIIDTDTKALYFVEQLGEPKKKGGGELAHSGTSAWMQWEFHVKFDPSPSSRMRLMVLHVSLKGDGSRGQDRWEKGRASECTWNDLFLQSLEM
jgi:hypothetical protein